MAINSVNYQMAWRFDDKTGAPIWNKVEALPQGVALPPLPNPGDRIEVSIEGAQMFAQVLQAWLDYQIDSVPNITCTSHIWAKQI